MAAYIRLESAVVVAAVAQCKGISSNFSFVPPSIANIPP
jgi:hypothetical protein